jgi:hypothetical protein
VVRRRRPRAWRARGFRDQARSLERCRLAVMAGPRCGP